MGWPGSYELIEKEKKERERERERGKYIERKRKGKKDSVKCEKREQDRMGHGFGDSTHKTTGR